MATLTPSQDKVNSTTCSKEKGRVTVMGLGIMGRAVVQCFARQGYHVHAWNRGKTNRDLVKAMNLGNVTVYEDSTEAVLQSISPTGTEAGEAEVLQEYTSTLLWL